jgi:hypothetical protein
MKKYPSLYNIVRKKNVLVAQVLSTTPLNVSFRRALVGENWAKWMQLVGSIFNVQCSLNRFISKSAERSLPFFKALKGKGKIEWGQEQIKAFQELKDYIEKLAILVPPLPMGHLNLYITASRAAVTAALVREVESEKGKHQFQFTLSQKLLSDPSFCIWSWKRLHMQSSWPQESLGITLRRTRSRSLPINHSTTSLLTSRLRQE